MDESAKQGCIVISSIVLCVILVAFVNTWFGIITFAAIWIWILFFYKSKQEPYVFNNTNNVANNDGEGEVFSVAGQDYRGKVVEDIVSIIKNTPTHKLNNVDVKLKRQLNNDFDEYAVRVIINGVFCGYVPRYMSQEVGGNIDNNIEYRCTLLGLDAENQLVVKLIQKNNLIKQL